jgi:hypothetical protein
MEFTMRKHIYDTIGAKHEEMKTNNKQNDGPALFPLPKLNSYSMNWKRSTIKEVTC